MTIAEAQTAIRNGHFQEAEKLCERLISENPSRFDAWYLLGFIARRTNQIQKAIPIFKKVIAHNPTEANAYVELAECLRTENRPVEALPYFDRAIQLQPHFAEAYNGRGVAYYANRQVQLASTDFDTAVRLRPDYAEAYNNRGIAFFELGKLDQALADFEKAVALDPGYAEAHNSLGIALQKRSLIDKALSSFDRALALKPRYAEAYNNRGNALRELGRFADAGRDYDEAIRLRPTFAEAFNNRGLTYHHIKQFDKALTDFAKAISLNESYSEAYSNRGNSLMAQGRFDAALTSYDRAIFLSPRFAQARFNRSLLLLLLGRFEEGLPEYEYRLLLPDHTAARHYAQRRWLGDEDIAGKTLLIHPELYLGDMLQFSRYAKLAEQKGAKVVVAAQDSLLRLLRTLSPTIDVRSENAPPGDFDFHCPIMSLPLAFRTTLQSIPAMAPYLSAEEERVQKWRAKIGSRGFKIGICWQGSTQPYAVALERSLPLKDLVGISKLDNVRLISLQKTDGIEQLALLPYELPYEMKVETLGDEFDAGPDAFLDAAAVMHSLDLVVSIDTALAHLAGALARPTWLILKHNADWRWFTERTDSPWYPTMRIFRQKRAGDWPSAVNELECELRLKLAKFLG